MFEVNKNNVFLLEQIVKRDFASKYKGSVIGMVWSFLNPLLMMILLTIIFSTMFGSVIDNFAVYFLAGKFIFDFFSESVSSAMFSLKGNQNILRRTPAPKHIFVLGSIISRLITFAINFVIFLGVMIATHAEFHLGTMFLSIIPIFSLILMTTGIGLFLSVYAVRYTDIQHLWNVITMALMYASAIFYPISIIPEPYYDYVILNPLYWIIDQFRSFMIYGTIPSLNYIVNLLLISAIILVFGIIIFKRNEKKIVMEF